MRRAGRNRCVLRLAMLRIAAQDEAQWCWRKSNPFILSHGPKGRESKDAARLYRSSANLRACSGIGTLTVSLGSGSGVPPTSLRGNTPAQIGSA